MNLGDLVVQIRTDLSPLYTGLQAAETRMEQWVSQTENRLRSFKESAMLMAGVAGAIGAAFGVATKVAGDFEAKMNGVQSVSGATADELDKIRAAALKMGADTQFSSAEAANGFYELGKAGFTASEQLGTMPGVIALAGAAQTGIGEAAETTAGILRGFGLAASQAGMVADQLAKAANASAVDVSDLAESMKYVAPIAAASHQSLSEVNGILAVLGNNMIKGSQAGTSLRAMMVALQKPSDDAANILAKYGISIQDTQGRMLPLSDVIAQMRERMKGLTETQRANAVANIFGQESLSSVMALMNQAPGSIERMTKSMQNATGAAKEMADGLNKGVNFQAQQLAGSMETLGIVIGQDVAPIVTALLAKLTDLVNAFMGIPAPVRTMIEVLAGVVAGITGIVAITGGIVAALGSIAAGLSALGITLGTVAIAVRAFISAWGPWAAVAAGVAAASWLIVSYFQQIGEEAEAAGRAVLTLSNQLAGVSKDGGAAWGKFSKGVKLTKDEANAALLYLRTLTNQQREAGQDVAANEARIKQLQAFISKGDFATPDGPKRGAAVKAPPKKGGKGKDPRETALDTENAQYEAGMKTREAHLQRLISLQGQWGKETKQYAQIQKQINDLGNDHEKEIRTGAEARRKDAEQAISDEITQADRIGLKIRAANDYLAVLKAHKGTGDEAKRTAEQIRDVEREIRDLKVDQVKAQREIVEKGLQAAAGLAGGVAGMGASGAGDGTYNPTAVPQMVAGNAGAIAAMPGQLLSAAEGVQQFAMSLTEAMPYLSSALPALGPLFAGLAPILEGITTTLGGVIAGGLGAMLPIVGVIVGAMALLAMAWQEDAGGIQEALSNVWISLTALWEALSGLLMPVIEALGAALSFVGNAFAIVVSIVAGVIDGLTAFFGWIWEVTSAFNPLKAMIDGIVWVFKALWDALAAFVGWLTNGKVQLATSKDADKHQAAIETKKLESKETKFDLSSVLGKLNGTMTKIPDAVGQAVKTGVQEVFGAITSFNPLPVADVVRSGFFSAGPQFRFFQERSVKVGIDLSITGGSMSEDQLVQLAQSPSVRAALADAVKSEEASFNLRPVFGGV